MTTKRIGCVLAALAILIIFCFAPAFKSHADAIGSQTVDSNLLAGTGHYSTYVAVGFGSGNWTTVNLDPGRKYYVRNFGFDSTGATASNNIKAVLGSAAEPDAGAAISYTAAVDVEYIKPNEAIFPIKGTSKISFKADTGTTMLIVRTIETEPQER